MAGSTRSAPSTRAPSAKRRAALAHPMPEAAPVTTTHLAAPTRLIGPSAHRVASPVLSVARVNKLIQDVQMSTPQSRAGLPDGERGGRQPTGAPGLAGRRGTEERILDAAERCMGRLGLGRVSMTDVAAQAGVSRGSVYLHFGDRASLVDAVLARVATRFVASSEVGRAPAAHPGRPGRRGGGVHPPPLG